MADKKADAKSEFKSNSFKKESKSVIEKRDKAKTSTLQRISKALQERGRT